MIPNLIKSLLLSIILINGHSLHSQSDEDKQKAYDKGMEAIKLMDNGQIEKSIKLLEDASKLDPKNYLYPYEIGYAYYLQKNYSEAIKVFEKVIKMKNITAQCYQMLGNIYDYDGKRAKAIKIYNKGLEKFPNSGRLYLELGNVHQNAPEKALEYYEKGIELEPAYPSNYYWATKLFCESSEKVWGMMYGEIFMNIERGTKRTEEISKLLFDTYLNEINFTSDSSMSVSFCQSNVMSISENKPKLPYCMVYETCLMVAIAYDTITLESLNKIRKDFINIYYNRKFNEMHPNPLFEWHQSLVEKEMFEYYNYWLLMKGTPAEFDKWYVLNKEKFDSFINWFSKNPMPIDEKNKFHRYNYN